MNIKTDKYILNTYNRNQINAVSGNGSILVSEDKNYIDFTSGIGVNSLGFCDKEWSKAIAEQACKLNHVSNLFYSQPQANLAEKLIKITGYDKVFFANSGAEANECAIKVARKYSFDKYGKDRNVILTLVNSFHGRTMATLTATGQETFHNYFFPFLDGFKYVDVNEENLNEFFSDNICAVMLEFVQGEGGVLPLSQELVNNIKTICEEKDILIIGDEVQTGVGRCGSFLASEKFGVFPDITTLAKGLGGGLPIGACLCNKKTAVVMTYSTHGSTFGGNPIVCAGANVVVDKISEEKFLLEVNEKAEIIKKELLTIKDIEISGLGMMIGFLVKGINTQDIIKQCAEQGLLVLSAKNKVRLLPPLNIENKQLVIGLNIIKKTVAELQNNQATVI